MEKAIRELDMRVVIIAKQRVHQHHLVSHKVNDTMYISPRNVVRPSYGVRFFRAAVTIEGNRGCWACYKHVRSTNSKLTVLYTRDRPAK